MTRVSLTEMYDNRSVIAQIVRLKDRVTRLEESGEYIQAQADWDQTDPTLASYIRNKPEVTPEIPFVDEEPTETTPGELGDLVRNVDGEGAAHVWLLREIADWGEGPVYIWRKLPMGLGTTTGVNHVDKVGALYDWIMTSYLYFTPYVYGTITVDGVTTNVTLLLLGITGTTQKEAIFMDAVQNTNVTLKAYADISDTVYVGEDEVTEIDLNFPHKDYLMWY